MDAVVSVVVAVVVVGGYTEILRIGKEVMTKCGTHTHKFPFLDPRCSRIKTKINNLCQNVVFQVRMREGGIFQENHL